MMTSFALEDSAFYKSRDDGYIQCLAPKKKHRRCCGFIDWSFMVLRYRVLSNICGGCLWKSKKAYKCKEVIEVFLEGLRSEYFEQLVSQEEGARGSLPLRPNYMKRR